MMIMRSSPLMVICLFPKLFFFSPSTHEHKSTMWDMRLQKMGSGTCQTKEIEQFSYYNHC